MKKIIYPLFIAFCFLIAMPAMAFCPICLAGTGFGALIFYFITHNLFLSGIFLGAFFVSLSLMIISAISKKFNLSKVYRSIIGICIFISLFSIIEILLYNYNIPYITNSALFTVIMLYGAFCFFITIAFTNFIQQKWLMKYLSAQAKLLIIILYFALLFLSFYIIF